MISSTINSQSYSKLVTTMLSSSYITKEFVHGLCHLLLTTLWLLQYLNYLRDCFPRHSVLLNSLLDRVPDIAPLTPWPNTGNEVVGRAVMGFRFCGWTELPTICSDTKRVWEKQHPPLHNYLSVFKCAGLCCPEQYSSAIVFFRGI